MADIGVRLVILGLAEFRRGIATAQSDVKGFEGAIRTVSGTAAGIGTSLTTLGSSITGVGRTMSLFVTGPLVALGAGFIAAGIKFEDAFAGVGKVVSGVSVGFDEIAAAAKEKLGITITTMDEAAAAAKTLGMAFGDLTPLGQSLRQQFIDLGDSIPLPINQLAELGVVVGQLGVPADKLISTTTLIAKFATVTGMSAEDAASSLLHLGNILEGSTLDFEDFTARAGSAIIALGNKSVSTEPEILALATRIAAAGDRAKFSEPDLLAWATAISDVGVRAELGGTAVSRAITDMVIAVQTGGKGIEEFAQVSGKSVDQFKHDFEVDASGAMQDFIVGLKDAFEAGTVTKDMLAAMGLSGVRAIDVMGRLGNIQDILADRISTSNDAWDKAIKIQDEFAKRANTVQNMIQIMKNQFSEMGIVIFDLVKSDLQKLIEGIGTLIRHFLDLDPATQKMILGFALVAAAIGPILIVVGALISAIGIVVTAFAGIVGAIVPITIALAGAALGFSLFGDDAIGFIQPVIDKIKELVGIIIGVPKDIPSPVAAPAFASGDIHAPGTPTESNFPTPEQLPDPSLIERIGLAFQNLKNSITIPPFIIDAYNILRSVIEALPKVIIEVEKTVVGTFNRIMTFLGPFIEAIGKTASPQLQESLDSLKKAFADLAPTIEIFKQAWAELLPILVELVPVAILGIVLGISLFILAIVNAIHALSSIGPALNMVFEGIAHLALGMAQIFSGILTFGKGIQQVMTAISTFIIGVFKGIPIADLINPLITGVLTGLQTMLAGIITWASGVLNNFIGLFQILGGIVAAGFAYLLSLVGGWITTVIGFFVNLYETLVGGSIIPDLVSAIISNFVTMISTVISNISSFVANFIAKITELKDQIVDLITQMQKLVGQKIKSMGDDMTNAMGAAAGAIDTVKNAFASLLGWLKGNAQKLIELAGAIGGAISGAVGSGSPAFNSPQFGVFYGFKDLNSLIAKQSGKLTSNMDMITSSFESMNSSRSGIDSMMSALSSALMPNTGVTGNSQIDKSVNTTISGIPISDENDLAALIDQRVRVARGLA